MYILKESLFSFEELQKIESKELLIFFSALDLRPYAKELRKSSPRGAVTPAHVNDGDEGPVLIKLTVDRFKPRFFMLDAGYDQMKNYETARKVKAQAIIPMNPRNEKEPPAGMTTKGTPCCSMGFPRTY